MRIVDVLEALLFVADSPTTLAQLAGAADATEGQAEQALEVLQHRYQERGALQLVKLAGGYQIATKPEFAETVAAFVKPQRHRLSRSLLEVLAIVAYRQPITLAEIEAVRGVQSDYALRGLLDRRLLRELGRKRVPGRPYLYGTSKEFLHHFQLNDLSELPALEAGPLLERPGTGEPSLFESEPHRVH